MARCQFDINSLSSMEDQDKGEASDRNITSFLVMETVSEFHINNPSGRHVIPHFLETKKTTVLSLYKRF
jgi:hypothetical protein